MKHTISGLLTAGLTLALAASAPAATVSVEVEGHSVVVPPTATATAPTVTKGSYTCSTPDSVLSALDTLTAGDWDGVTYGPSVPERIRTETHTIVAGGSSWAFYVNGKFVNGDSCSSTLHDGDKVLWFWSDAYASEGYDEPVFLDAPASAVPGTPFTVSVQEAHTDFPPPSYEGTTTLSPSEGATVSGGAAAVTTGADGKAAVTVAGGPYTLVATKGNRAPARVAGCATNGHDGFCGTTKDDTSAAQSAPVPTVAAPPCQTTGDDGRCGSPDKRAAYGSIASVAEQQHFAHGKGPRELTGHVADEPSGIADVRLRLTRTNRGRCSTYDAKREVFKAMKKCGAARGSWFSVGTSSDWRYLLPEKLGPGRYVLDVLVIDKAGNRDAQLARGRNRVVFFVG
jgi:hypothetical protein